MELAANLPEVMPDQAGERIRPVYRSCSKFYAFHSST